ncbi:hypothetical protein IAR55_001696 [Kwoniella newhampshirensis]|uniref:Spermidine synthase n=1 Tax=Kwoniella newhampshirensis TaxID=1651941 RepID=A0AAW0Z2W1_9TREE
MSKVTFDPDDTLISPATPYDSGTPSTATGISDGSQEGSSGEDVRSEGDDLTDEEARSAESYRLGSEEAEVGLEDRYRSEEDDQSGLEGSPRSGSSNTQSDSESEVDPSEVSEGEGAGIEDQTGPGSEPSGNRTRGSDREAGRPAADKPSNRPAAHKPSEKDTADIDSRSSDENKGRSMEPTRMQRDRRNKGTKQERLSTTPPDTPSVEEASQSGQTRGKERSQLLNSSERHRPSEEEAQADLEGSEQIEGRRRSSDLGDPANEEPSRKLRIPRTWKHDMARLAALYLFPVLLAIPVSLLLSLNTLLLTPLYNSIPLTLHIRELYFFYALPPSLLYCYITLHRWPRQIVSARVCLSFAALSGDLVAVFGRKVGSVTGTYAGPEWGSLGARAMLGVGAVTASTAFALLCFDYIIPLKLAEKPTEGTRNFILISLRSAAYIVLIWGGERLWNAILSSSPSVITPNPEKSILFISLLLTILSLLVRPSTSTTPFSTQVNTFLTSTFRPSPQARTAMEKMTNTLLPSQAFPLILLLRLPLLVLALRQQIFLRPPTSRPYVTAHGELRILSSERSLTGQVVVAENLKDGYRFLRCDHSILGGRWIRDVPDKNATDGKRTEMGDSIFATFNLQEVAVLVHRSDWSDSLINTLALTTDLEVGLEGSEDEGASTAPDRALIIGLGAGIAASAFSKRGIYVDVVEIDPVVYVAAQTHFDLSSYPPFVSTNIIDGASFISQLAAMKRSNTTSEEQLDLIPRWDYVVQDCFTGGKVPGEMFTREFWEDLGELMVDDGVMAMNFAGIIKSKASRAVLVTLLSVFEQCRAFGDGFELAQGPNDMVNMVVFCTKSYSPLLTFRPPTSTDVLRSPLRSHVYSTFLPHEIQLDTVVSEKDWEDPELMLKRGEAEDKLNQWQVGTSLATWRAMQKILTPEMWLAY